jgi:hypothetical protein
VRKTDVRDLHRFADLPSPDDWYGDRMKDVLWKLHMQKFGTPLARSRLRGIRGRRFVFTDGFGGRPPDAFFSGFVSSEGKVNGRNYIGECLTAIRRHSQMKLIVLVTGGRDFEDHQMVHRVLSFLNSVYHIATVVHGGAAGADRAAGYWSRLNKKDEKVFKAHWDQLDVEKCVVKTNSKGHKYNALAGLNRNTEMADYLKRIDLNNKDMQVMVVGFTGGSGTHHMLLNAFTRSLPTFYQDELKMKRVIQMDGDEPTLEEFRPTKDRMISGKPWF